MMKFDYIPLPTVSQSSHLHYIIY